MAACEGWEQRVPEWMGRKGADRRIFEWAVATGGGGEWREGLNESDAQLSRHHYAAVINDV